MKPIIKLAIVALIANAIWRVGVAYSSHYRFTDAVQQTTQYRSEKSDDQVHDLVFELASQYGIPVSDENLTVRRQENHTIVEGSYVRSILLFPGFTYQWPFTLHIDTFVTKAPALDPSTVPQ